MLDLAALEPAQKQHLASLLAEVDRRRRTRVIETMFPDTGKYARFRYPKHLEFFRLGATHNERVFMAGNRVGKALKNGTPVATPQGWVPIERLSPGDEVFAGNGEVTRVVGVYPQGLRECVTVTFDVGERVTCDLDHLWLWQHPRARFETRVSHGKKESNPFFGQWQVSTTAEIRSAVGESPLPKRRPVVPTSQPWRFPAAEVPIDPYLLGVLVGDGGLTNGVRFSTADQYIADEVAGRVAAGLRVRKESAYDYHIVVPGGMGSGCGGRGPGNPLLTALRGLGLAGCGSAAKFVPQAYLHNAAEVRLAVLQGLMDTDGSITQTGAMEFSTASERLAENVEFLVHSLGGKVSVERRQTKFTNKHGDRVNGLPSLRLRIRLNVCPFRLPRKAERWTPRKNTPNRVIHHIEAAGAHECTCIEVAHHDHTFVTAHGIVTHNTVAAGTETTYHLTGKYPNWWDGRRFDRPVRALASGDTHETTRDILQLKMVGATTDKPENIGTGLIPGDDITGIVPRPHVKGAIEKVTVRHVSGGESELWLRSYEQGREIFQGFELDIFWPDEECPEDVYEEGQVRLMTRNGISMLTFTPLNGLTKLVQQLTAKTDDPVVMASRSVVQCGWDHVPHLDEDAKARLLAKLMPHQRDARTKGVPSLGAGAIYPVPETDIVVDDFALPAYWPRAYGMDVGWNRTAAIWGAHDREADVVYLYSEHYRSQAEPSIHADAIKARGVWIPGAIDPAARGRQQKDGEQLLQNYQDLGLDLTAADNAREAGIYNVWQRLSTGRMKVFKSLQNWLNEYRIYRRDDKGQVVKENDHAMDATRYLEMSGIAIARVPPRVEKPARRGNWRTV